MTSDKDRETSAKIMSDRGRVHGITSINDRSITRSNASRFDIWSKDAYCVLFTKDVRKMGNELTNVLDFIARFLLIAVLGFYILSIYMIQKDNLGANMVVLGTIGFVAMAWLFWKVSRSVKTDRAGLILTLCAEAFVLIIWNLIYKPVPVSDYQVLWEGAERIVDGTFRSEAADVTDYFFFYNFQIGYTMYMAILMKLFGGSLVSLKIAEIVVMTLTVGVLYKTVRLFANVQDSIFCGLVFSFYPFIFLGSGIINNQHEALLFEALAVFFYLDRKTHHAIWSGVFITVAQIMRPTAMVILLAMIVCSVIYGIVKKDKWSFVKAAEVLGTYEMLFNVVNAILIGTGYAPYGIKGTNPYFKLSIGLTGQGITGQGTTDARHTDLYYDLQTYNFDYNAYKDAAKTYFTNLLSTHGFNYNWIWNKVIDFAGSLDNQYGFADGGFNSAHPVVVGFLNMIGLLVYFTSIVFSFIYAILKKTIVKDEQMMLFSLIYGAYFIVYIFIEKQPRYRYEQYYFLIILGLPIAVKAAKWLRVWIHRAGASM